MWCGPRRWRPAVCAWGGGGPQAAGRRGGGRACGPRRGSKPVLGVIRHRGGFMRGSVLCVAGEAPPLYWPELSRVAWCQPAVRSAPCNLFIASSFQTIRGLGLGGRGPLTAGGGLDPARPGVGGGGVNLDIFGRGEHRVTQALNGSWARRPSGTARSFHEMLGRGPAARGALANGGLPGASSPGFAAPRSDFHIFGRGGGGGHPGRHPAACPLQLAYR